jgi:cell division protein FtsL
MNAAARNINQITFFHGQLAFLRVSRNLCIRTLLFIVILVSALSVVYTTNLYRTTMSKLESELAYANDLEVEWGQLLLERASLATTSRVQQLSENKLHMVLPNNLVILQLQE